MTSKNAAFESCWSCGNMTKLLHVNDSLAFALLRDKRVSISLCGQRISLSSEEIATGEVSPLLRIAIDCEQARALDEIFGISNPVTVDLLHLSTQTGITQLILKPTCSPLHESSRGWFAVCQGKILLLLFTRYWL